MARDLFYDYLEYCENVELIGPGEFVEIFAPHTRLAWTHLTIDLRDTWKAGRLTRLRSHNGSAAYVRPQDEREISHMSMWDKDKAFAEHGPLKERFPKGSKLILRDAWVQVEDFETSLGTAPMVHLVVSDLIGGNDAETLTVSMIGDNIANMIRDPETKESRIAKGDLPAVVETREVETDQPQPAFVLRFIEPWDKDAAKKYNVPF